MNDEGLTEDDDNETDVRDVTPVDESELRTTISLLESIVSNRARLAYLEPATRQRLMEVAGRLSRPTRSEQRILAKELRRKDKRAVQAVEQQKLDATGIRVARRAPIFQTPEPSLTLPAPMSDSSSAPPAPDAELREARKCYVCKEEFRRIHFFYDQLCPPCAEFNHQKRLQSSDLHDRVAIVTGARVKIGYQSAIFLLRAGARVIVTTRFPHDAALRYAREPDYESWADRLEIFGLDLRFTPAVERFVRFVDTYLPRLDFIIHNACQTVRRPPGYYAHLLDLEASPLDALPLAARPLVARYAHERQLLATREDAFFSDPARLSQLALTNEDRAIEGHKELFPRGQLDQDLQQVDKRDRNSWRLTLAEVPTVELLEVYLVNAVAPFVMSSKLKPLMKKIPSHDKHIVNVSAVEGQFYRDHKTDKHPHTNMAKAALNMLTRTSAQDYVKDGIHINSVDTGWVTDEDPIVIASRKQVEHGFHPPLDIVDGAARICDPIFSGLNTGVHAFGQFFKDYKPTPW
jgi:NAD(P)-dependent dehydrogenase (short-subunit alcohol dehydrogenase family)